MLHATEPRDKLRPDGTIGWTADFFFSLSATSLHSGSSRVGVTLATNLQVLLMPGMKSTATTLSYPRTQLAGTEKSLREVT